MPHPLQLAAPAALLAALCSLASVAGDLGGGHGRGHDGPRDLKGWSSRGGAQLGDRPFYLVDGLEDSRLKDKLQRCEGGPFY